MLQHKFELILIIIILFLITLLFMKWRTDKVLDDLENNLNTITFMDKISTDRELNINKIKHIINIYKPEIKEAVKDSVANLIYNMSLKYENLTTELICAVITHESGWDNYIESSSGAIGLMQVMPETAKVILITLNEYFNLPIDFVLKNPYINIRIGCEFLNMAVNNFGLKGGLVEYNAGNKWANHYKKTGSIIPQETKGYVPAVLVLYDKYRL